jgi:hypothetical protein
MWQRNAIGCCTQRKYMTILKTLIKWTIPLNLNIPLFIVTWYYICYKTKLHFKKLFLAKFPKILPVANNAGLHSVSQHPLLTMESYCTLFMSCMPWKQCFLGGGNPWIYSKCWNILLSFLYSFKLFIINLSYII